MAQQRDPVSWEKARRVRDRLEQQFLTHPGVRLIDIGCDEANEAATSVRSIVLQVHVTGAASGQSLNIPDEIDGIPVRIHSVPDYRPE